MKFDLVIFSAPKDFNKLRYTYESLEKIEDEINKIYCFCPELPKEKIDGIEYVLDDEIIQYDFDKFNVNVKKSWIKQQCMKLFQEITIDDYFVIDSDVYINKKLKIYQNNKPTFFLGRNQFHVPYFVYLKQIMNLKREYNHSFINEMMLFKREVIEEMLKDFSGNRIDFMDRTSEILNGDNILMSEFELYGNYTYKKYPELYNFEQKKTHLNGKHTRWENNELELYLESYKSKDYDILSMHSWGI